MEHRTIIVREEGSAVGTVSFIALLLIAGFIALMIWQPWNGTVMMRSTTTTTSFDTTSGTR